jgi:hypothetical protein
MMIAPRGGAGIGVKAGGNANSLGLLAEGWLSETLGFSGAEGTRTLDLLRDRQAL